MVQQILMPCSKAGGAAAARAEISISSREMAVRHHNLPSVFSPSLYATDLRINPIRKQLSRRKQFARSPGGIFAWDHTIFKPVATGGPTPCNQERGVPLTV